MKHILASLAFLVVTLSFAQKEEKKEKPEKTIEELTASSKKFEGLLRFIKTH